MTAEQTAADGGTVAAAVIALDAAETEQDRDRALDALVAAARVLPTAAPAQGDRLTEAEREALSNTLLWHFRCHAAEPDKSYASLGIENALLCVERILAARQRPEAVIAAEAWDEGVAVGAEYESRRSSNDPDDWAGLEIPVNPYRAAHLAESTPDGA